MSKEVVKEEEESRIGTSAPAATGRGRVKKRRSGTDDDPKNLSVTDIARDPTTTNRYRIVTRNGVTGERTFKTCHLGEAISTSKRTGIKIRHDK